MIARTAAFGFQAVKLFFVLSLSVVDVLQRTEHFSIPCHPALVRPFCCPSSSIHLGSCYTFPLGLDLGMFRFVTVGCYYDDDPHSDPRVDQQDDKRQLRRISADVRKMW